MFSNVTKFLEYIFEGYLLHWLQGYCLGFPPMPMPFFHEKDGDPCNCSLHEDGCLISS